MAVDPGGETPPEPAGEDARATSPPGSCPDVRQRAVGARHESP
jgi:hypothetical protein